MSYHLYVSISGEDKIKIFDIYPRTGRLKSLGEVLVTGRPVHMAIDPSRQFIYIVCMGIRKICTYLRNRETGNLSLIGTASFALESNDGCSASELSYLATDRKGRFLLSTYYDAGAVAVQPIGSDGIVGNPPIEWLETGKGAHSVQTDPSNRFVFVPHTAHISFPGYTGDGRGLNSIRQFKFNEVTGRLTPNKPDTVILGEGVGPRHFCFHPNLDIVYFSNEQGSSVTTYGFDSSIGTLNSLQTTSTLPNDYKEGNWCADIGILPSGKFLYCSNRGHNSIACFSVNAYNGSLTPVRQIPTEANPRSFSMDPDGDFLFATGRDLGRLVSYSVNGGTGELKILETYVVGKDPMWVLITRAEAAFK